MLMLPHPDAIPCDQPYWLPGMSRSSFHLLGQLVFKGHDGKWDEELGSYQYM